MKSYKIVAAAILLISLSLIPTAFSAWEDYCSLAIPHICMYGAGCPSPMSDLPAAPDAICYNNQKCTKTAGPSLACARLDHMCCTSGPPFYYMAEYSNCANCPNTVTTCSDGHTATCSNTCPTNQTACSTCTPNCAICYVDGVQKSIVPKTCSASQLIENVNAITDSWCTYNEAGTCKYLKCGVTTVDGNCNLHPTANYWAPDKTCGSGDTSTLWGEKTIFVDDISKYTQIDAKIGIDDYSHVWINNVEVPQFNTHNTATGWINVKSFFRTGNNIVNFSATDTCGWDGSGGDCGGRIFDVDWNVTINPAITVSFNASAKLGQMMAYVWLYGYWISFDPATNTCNQNRVIKSALAICRADVNCRTTDAARITSNAINVYAYCGDNYMAYHYDCIESLPQGGTQTGNFDVMPTVNTLRTITSCTVDAKSGSGAWKNIGDCKTSSLFTIRAGTDCAWNQDCTVRISATNDAGTSSSAEKTFTISDTTTQSVSTSFSASSGSASSTIASVSCSVDAYPESGCIIGSNCDPASYKMYVSSSQITGCPDYSSSSYSSVSSSMISSKSWVCSAAKDTAGNPAVSSVSSWDIAPLCGNGIVDSGENCDGSNLNSQTCASQGFSAGTLSCTSSCTFNTASCCSHACSSGVKECISGTTRDYHVCQDTSLCRTWGATASCSSGQTCSGGNCVCVPTTEVCNGADDNCNGQVDENLGTSSCGKGACARTVNNCVNGQTQTCVPGTPTAEICGNTFDEDCNGLPDSSDPACAPPTITVTTSYAYNWVNTPTIYFDIRCDDPQQCKKLEYSTWKYNATESKYYNIDQYYFANSTTGNTNSILIKNQNISCPSGKTCITKLKITATDGYQYPSGNVNITISNEIKIDLQAPTIEKRECMYKIKGSTKLTNCLAITETTPIFVGSNVTLNAIANDSNGIGVFNISIYIINESGNQILMKTAVADLTPLGRKNGSTTATIKEIGTYKYKIVAEDYLGNVNISDAGSFRIGGSDKVSCKEQGGDLCKEYQACAASIEPANDDDERIGKYCCIPLGNCINRSMLATCAGQSGIIYDPFVYDCSGATVPSSDTIEKNKCCKGTITAKKKSVAWYDMAGNKLAGAARGDKVKCIGASEQIGKYNLTITLGSKIISQSVNIPVSSAKRAELGPVTLIETGTYKCAGTFSSP